MMMKYKRLVALVVAALTAATTGTGGVIQTSVVAAGAQTQAPPQSIIHASQALVVSGQVLRRGSRDPVADVQLQLRNLDSGAIVGHTTSDKNGNYSFAVPAPGNYLVEAVKDNGGVIAVGEVLNVTGAVVLANVILGANKALLALLVVGIAGGAGVAAWAIDNTTSSSPER